MYKQNLPIKTWAEDDRPREKMLEKGSKVLSDSELLALLIQSGTREKSALDLAKDLLAAHENSLPSLVKKSPLELQQLKGIGKAKAAILCAAFELGLRLGVKEKPNNKKITSSELAFRILSPYFVNLTHEEFHVLFLNRANKAIQIKLLSIGGLTGTIADKRILFKEAVQCGSTGIILAHNHPSGNLKASEHDKQITREIKSICELFDIQLIDHLIIYQDSFYSFSDNGIL